MLFKITWDLSAPSQTPPERSSNAETTGKEAGMCGERNRKYLRVAARPIFFTGLVKIPSRQPKFPSKSELGREERKTRVLECSNLKVSLRIIIMS